MDQFRSIERGPDKGHNKKTSFKKSPWEESSASGDLCWTGRCTQSATAADASERNKLKSAHILKNYFSSSPSSAAPLNVFWCLELVAPAPARALDPEPEIASINVGEHSSLHRFESILNLVPFLCSQYAYLVVLKDVAKLVGHSSDLNFTFKHYRLDRNSLLFEIPLIWFPWHASALQPFVVFRLPAPFHSGARPIKREKAK